MTQLGIYQTAPVETRNRERFWWAACTLIATSVFLLGQFWLQGDQLVRGPANEFLLTYGAASIADSADIYSVDGLAYRQTPLTVLAALPLTWLPYPNAYWVWMLLGIWSVVAFVALWRPPSSRWTLTAIACSAPLFVGFLDGRETPFLLLGLALTVFLVRLGRPFRAGLALTLCALQWQLFLLVPLLLAAQRRWRVLGGLATGLGISTLVTTALAGPDWPLRMIGAWNAFPVSVGAEPTLVAVLDGIPRATELLGVVALVLATFTWTAGRKTSLETGLAAALAAGLILSPRAELADAVVLLPAALTAASQARLRSLRALGFLLLTPIPYLVAGSAHSAQVLVAAVLTFLGLVAVETLGRSTQAAERAKAPAASTGPHTRWASR